MAAFETLVQQHERLVYNLALRTLGNDADAQDAAQEAFIKAWTGLGSFRGDSKFSVWLYRLTNNVCLDMLRKRNEIGRTVVSIRQVVNVAKIKKARELLREYFDVMDVPSDEDGLVAFISEKFETQKSHYDALDERYNNGRHYPDRAKVQQAIKLTEDVFQRRFLIEAVILFSV